MEKRKNRLGRGIHALLQNESQDAISELDLTLTEPTKQKAANKQTAAVAAKPQTAPKQAATARGASTELPLQTLLFLKVDSLSANPFQPRKQFNEERLEELSASIREQGILQPLVITDNPDLKQSSKKKTHIILAGERRWRAAKKAGLDSVPAIYVKATASKNIEASLTENIQRENLNSIELAKSFHALLELRSCTQEDLAKSLGLSRPVVSNTLRLLTLSPEIQSAIEEQRISQSHARLLLQLKGAAQKDLFQKIQDNSLNIRETEDLLQQSLHGKKTGQKQGPTKKGKQGKEAHLQELEQQLVEKFGTRVVLSGSIEKGFLSLYYYSKEDLARIAEILDVRSL